MLFVFKQVRFQNLFYAVITMPDKVRLLPDSKTLFNGIFLFKTFHNASQAINLIEKLLDKQSGCK
jgi:hypothetical protein